MTSKLPPTNSDFSAANASYSGHEPVSAPFRDAAILGFLGVGLGAFGAHGLKGYLETSGLDAAGILERTSWWETAAHYHLVHAVALLSAGAGCAIFGTRTRSVTWCFALGIALFSGTLYAMALGAPRWFGAITPIGGVLLMAGWGATFLACRPRR